MNRRGKRRPVRAGARVDPRMLVAAVLLVAAVVGVWLAWAGPARSRAADLNAQLTQAREQVTTVRAKIADLKSGQTSGAPELLAQALALDAQIPAALDKVDVVATVPALAAGYGLQVTRMDPASSQEGNALVFDAQVSGPHGQVMAFLEAITSPGASPLLSVGELSVDVAEERTTASFTLRAHFSGVAPLGSQD